MKPKLLYLAAQKFQAMTRPRIYLSILALIALYALMGNMDRAWLEAEAESMSVVFTIRPGPPDEGIEHPEDMRFAVLPMVEAKECP